MWPMNIGADNFHLRRLRLPRKMNAPLHVQVKSAGLPGAVRDNEAFVDPCMGVSGLSGLPDGLQAGAEFLQLFG